MLVITSCGGCETKYKELRVVFEQLTKHGMYSQARSTLLRIMALFATHCFQTPSQQLVEFRQKCYRDSHLRFALCMVGTLHTVRSCLIYDCPSANATQGCHHFLPHLHVLPLWPQAHVCKFGNRGSSTSFQTSPVEHTATLTEQSSSPV